MGSSVNLNRSFLLAAAQGDVKTMEKCIWQSGGSCAEARDADNSICRQLDKDPFQSDFRNTALHLACLAQQNRSVQFLCGLFPHMVHSTNRHGESPVSLMPRGISRLTLESFIKAGADFTESVRYGGNVLWNLSRISVDFFEMAVNAVPCRGRVVSLLNDYFPAVLSRIVWSYYAGKGCTRRKALNEGGSLSRRFSRLNTHTFFHNAIGQRNIPLLRRFRNDPEVDWSLPIYKETRGGISTLGEEADRLIREDDREMAERSLRSRVLELEKENRQKAALADQTREQTREQTRAQLIASCYDFQQERSECPIL